MLSIFSLISYHQYLAFLSLGRKITAKSTTRFSQAPTENGFLNFENRKLEDIKWFSQFWFVGWYSLEYLWWKRCRWSVWTSSLKVVSWVQWFFVTFITHSCQLVHILAITLLPIKKPRYITKPMQHIGASHIPGSFCWCMPEILPLAYFIATYSDNILAKQLPEIYWDSDILSKTLSWQNRATHLIQN